MIFTLLNEKGSYGKIIGKPYKRNRNFGNYFKKGQQIVYLDDDLSKDEM